jgi:hypothetical protein
MPETLEGNNVTSFNGFMNINLKSKTNKIHNTKRPYYLRHNDLRTRYKSLFSYLQINNLILSF